MDNFNNLVSGIPETEDLVSDGWTDIIGNLLIRMRRGEGEMTTEGIAQTMELADFEKMEQIRARVDQIVEDPVMAEALKPWYRQFCKRPCFHDDYLPTFNRPNVTLVDTDGLGVQEITERGVIVNGKEYELDCLIYATGFEVGTEYARRAGYEVHGRDGVTLTEKWAEGASTLHGFYSRGFPNCFVVSIVQSGFSANFPHMLDEQSKHLAYVLAHAEQHDITLVEASQEAEDAWVQTIVDLAQYNVRFLEACTPGYYNNEGRPADRTVRNGSYGAGSPAFITLLEQWRDAGDLAGLELTQ
jgi:cyclohexanone monooxygenase